MAKNEKRLTSIVFVCHGNICRSPMAEFVMKDLVKRKGLEDRFDISSAAVSDEEWGNPIYPPAKRKLKEKGIPFTSHSAHKISLQEYRCADIVVIMDESNRRLLRWIVPYSEDMGKVHLLMEYTGSPRSVADPWYSGDFEKAYCDILEGCEAMMERLLSE